MDGSVTPHKEGAALPPAGAKARIAPQLRAAIKLRIEEGLTIKEACLRAGYSEAGWHLAMKRPAVQIEYERAEMAFIQTVERRRKGYKARAIEVAADLMERGTSEAVRMRAVEFFAGEAKQSGVAVQVNVGPNAGYVYAKPDTLSEGQQGQVIDVTPKSE